jgi:hypothetical protein
MSGPALTPTFTNAGRVDTLSKQESDARKAIAGRLVWAYMLLLLASVAVPVVLFFTAQQVPDANAISAIKEISAPATAAVSSVTGVIGFVLGYYFKSEERRA